MRGVLFVACNHPLKAFPIGRTENDKVKYKICSYEVDHLEKIGNEWKKILTPDIVIRDNFVTDFVKIPCGRCLGCRLEYSKKWSERLLAEKVTSSSALFLTFTYNDDSIPYSIIENKDFGDIIECYYTLCKKDFQDFWKRLRYHFRYHPEKISYFLCGEYGTATFRPHGHAIVYNLPVLELELDYYKTIRGHVYYKSRVLDNIWSNGFVTVSDFSLQNAAYVARYTMKKAGLKSKEVNDEYVDHGLCPEFLCMSRRPGIGSAFYDIYKERLMNEDRLFFGDESGSVSLGRNRFFNKKLEKDFGDTYELWKSQMIDLANAKFDAELMRTDLDELEYLRIREESLKNKTRILKRRDLDA